MLRRLGIRAKVLAVLAVPMIVLLAAGAYISYDALRTARSAAAAATVVEVLEQYGPVGIALQNERALSVTTVRDREQLDAARQATDSAIAALKPITAKVDLSEFPDGVVDAFKESQVAHNTALPAVRSLVDQDGTTATVQRSYNSIIGNQIGLVGQIADSMANRELARYVVAYHALSTTAEDLVNEVGQGVAIIESSAASGAAQRSYSTQTAATEISRDNARVKLQALGSDQLRVPAEDPTTAFQSKRGLIATTTTGKAVPVDAAEYTADIQGQLATISTVGTKVLTEAKDVAQAAAADARNTAIATIAIAILAAIASFAFAIVVSRGIVNPLRRLTAAAGDVQEQLPRLVEQVAVPGEGPGLELVQIPVTSSDEVGQLAAAFNSVNATTLHVAQEQAALRGSIAEMFVNVARRDQVLLNRQLSFIDSLERSEEDPNTLANLFRLDHLATRMRRNAESLLVLAGIDSGRRVRDAMPLSDVIRTASSEIEQYDRIHLDLPVDPLMHGFNALGAAHLLAEIFENATIFSEPETPVEVKTGVIGEFVVVQVLDHGLGMSDIELEAANHKIASTSASDALGAQRLGLFVVGRLSNRLGAEVRLSKSQRGTGTVTTVRFPVTLFAASESPGFGAPQRIQQEAPAAAPAAIMPPSAQGLVEDVPVVEAVDLAALTDGATSLGLPRRRLRGDDDGDDTTGLSVSGLPTRAAKTFDEDRIVLAAPAEALLSPELSSESTGWTPAITAAPSGNDLPSRSRAATSAWQSDAEPQAAEPTPAAPTERAGLFTGFRGRTELPLPAPRELSPRAAAEALAAPHRAPVLPAPADQQAQPPQRRSVNGFEIPGLAPDDDDDAPAATDETQVWVPSWAQDPVAAPAAPAHHEPVDDWSPTTEHVASEPELATAEQYPAEPFAPEPFAPEPYAAPAEPVWAPTQAWDEPAAPAAPTFEPHAPSSAYPDFTAYSGYTGWATPVEERPAPRFTSPYSTSYEAPAAAASDLDESRAWNAGEQIDLPAAAPELASEPAVELAASPVAEPAAPAPLWEPVTAFEPLVTDASPAEPALVERSWDAPVQPWQEHAPAEAQWESPVTSLAWDQQPVADEVPWQPTVAADLQGWEQVAPASHAAPAYPQDQWTEQAVPGIVEDEPVAPAYVDTHAQTQLFTPIEAGEVAEAHASEPVVAYEPSTPSWAPAVPTSEPAPAFSDLVQGGEQGDDAKGKRRWGGLFGRRKPDGSPASEPLSSVTPPRGFLPDRPAEAVPSIAPAPAVRQSAWSVAPTPPVAPDAPATAAPGAWAPPPAPSPAASQTPHQVSSFFRPAGGANAAPAPWTPPDWSGQAPATAPAPAPRAPSPVAAASPASPPSAAPRVGALDDEVAAMLALRSDIQEQALSELSQLSAYRPSAVNGSTGSPSLTKRVPVAIPESLPLVTVESNGPSGRDAQELRSRLSSFQSGTSRGRRAAEEPSDTRQESEPLADHDQHSTPPAPRW
ncbi:nitrate- and nitrite sensing domain-containing protein [Cellulomonas sp. P22]|uniref:sensor histidine kinase n=1 Tax=Cellulomonas sp. P22 TaxID=3373189 RepID=UPI0037A4711D